MKMTFRSLLSAAAVCSAVVCYAFNPVPVYSTDFETPDGVKGWKRNDVWKVEKGVGVGGSSAYVWTCRDSKRYDISSFKLPGVKEGRMYEAKFKVKPLELKGKVGCTICWNGKRGWLGGAGGTVVKWGDKKLKPDADGWYELTVRMSRYLPPEMDTSSLQFYMHPGATGRVAFDDVTVKLIGEEKIGKVEFFTTSVYRNIAADGDVRFLACTEIPRKFWGSGNLIAELSYVGADGSKKTEKMDTSNPDYVDLTIPVSKLAMGRNPVSVTVKGKDGSIVGTQTLEFERVAKLPERRVWCDKYGRTIVDGKPFFPLGMFWSIGTLENVTNALERYAAGPFNCLQNYDHTLTVKQLDDFWAKGLRVVVGIKDVFAPVAPNILYPGMKIRYARPKKGTVLKTHEDEDRYLTNLANSFKDHPALLGWYGCDEFREEFHDRLKERYELMKKVDPGHPVFSTIAGHGNNATRFIDCTDTIGIDCYSIHHANKSPVSKPGFGEAWEGGDRTREVVKYSHGLLTIWQVPQAFANAWDHRGKRPELCFPTFMELRSQTWQEIAEGANGLFFYSYSQILNCKESKEAIEDYFQRTCRVAEEIRSQFDVLLLEPGPAATDMPKRVRVRTWRDGKKVYALVCNTHPESRKGTVTIPGKWTTGKIVFGGGVSLVNGVLALDMKPFEVGIVLVTEK